MASVRSGLIPRGALEHERQQSWICPEAGMSSCPGQSLAMDSHRVCVCVCVCVCVHGSVTHAQVGSTQLMVGSRKGCRCEPLAAAPAAAGAAPLGWDPRS